MRPWRKTRGTKRESILALQNKAPAAEEKFTFHLSIPLSWEYTLNASSPEETSVAEIANGSKIVQISIDEGIVPLSREGQGNPIIEANPMPITVY